MAEGRQSPLLGSYWAFVEHLHTRDVRADSLRFRATLYGGLLSVIFFVILVITGVLLMYFYVPSEGEAWQSMRALQDRLRFGVLLRTSHNLAAQAMVVTVVVHLVSLVARHAAQRKKLANWLVGVTMLLLTIALSYTGYLLPYDQLAYWAVTVGTNMAGSAPWIGPAVQSVAFGGAEVSGVTLLRFYTHHCITLPIALVVLLGVHLYRIRRDGGLTLPEPLREPGAWVRTRPDVIRWEVWVALMVCALVVAVSCFVEIPLGPEANPEVTPNPMKAPWYLVGLQELLHFHDPFVVSYVLPGLAICLLAALPLVPERHKTLSVGALSRGSLALLCGGLSAVAALSSIGAYHRNGTVLLVSALFVVLALTARRRAGLGARLGRVPWLSFTLLYLLVAYLCLVGVARFLRGPGWSLEL